ncbi:MAG: hypothetical protein K9G70_00195 [Prolixibacteraceae bacterium]|nr:hypothetical protein [Prolixibacteraceae bacterium]
MRTNRTYQIFNERSGTNQNDRKNPLLDELFFKIDDKSKADIIKFVLEFAENIVFYNTDNEPDGTFRDVFEGDDTIDMITLSSFQLNELDTEFHKIQSETNNLNSLPLFFISAFFKISSWKNSFNKTPELKNSIINLIDNEVKKVFSTLKLFCEKHDLGLNQHFSLFPKDWNNSKSLLIDTGNKNIFYSRLYKTLKHLISEIIDISQKHLNKQLLNYQKINPQIALLLTYIDLLQEASTEINKQTARYLNYYYKDILHFNTKEIIPDTVFLFPTITPNRPNIYIPKNSWFPAGKDQNGEEIRYITEQEFVLSHVRSEKFLALCHDNTPLQDINHKLINFYHLPNTIIAQKNPAKNNPKPLGWIIGHNILHVEEGVRKIGFKYTLNNFSLNLLKHRLVSVEKNSNIKSTGLLESALQVSFSSPEGWTSIPPSNCETFIKEDYDGIDKLMINILIDETEPSITPISELLFPEEINNELPLFKFTPNQQNPSLTNLFLDLVFINLSINVDVLGVKGLLLQNDFGTLDSSSPFMPFGPTPHVGSSFFIGHDTIFTHPLKELYINIDWFDTPDLDNGFQELYNGYSHIDNNQIFKTRLLSLVNKQWVPEDDPQTVNLFEDIEMEETPELTPVNNFRGIDNIETRKISLTENDKKGFNSVISRARSGWLKMELCYPPNAFGHKEYAELMKKNITESTKSKKVILPPNEPWTPQIKSISIDYSSSIDMVSVDKNKEHTGLFYQILPFGTKEVILRSNKKQFQLFPTIKAGGELFIGLTGVSTPQIFNVFFRLSDYISDFAPSDNTFTWYILNNEKWEMIEQNQIIEDQTNGFIQTGYITFDINKKIDIRSNGELPTGYTWIKLTANTDIRFFKNILDIRCEAIYAKYQPREEQKMTGKIKSYSIKSTGSYIPGVTEIEQPYASFGGKKAENHEEFIIRVSERLRHKNRMITIWDYEHLLLAEFSEINRVKCLPNTNKNLNPAPGNVLIVVVPILENIDKTSHIPALPRNILERMKRFVLQKSSPFARVEVANPIYEEIKLKFIVRFRKGLNHRHYTEVLQTELLKYFSPWLFSNSSQLDFGINIRGGTILYFLEKLPYVDFITNLSILQIVGDRIIHRDLSTNKNTTIKPTTPISIFISSDKHIINTITTEGEDIEGIEDMSLGNDFVIESSKSDEDDLIDGIDKLTLGLDFKLPEDSNEEQKNDESYIFIK